MKKLSNKPGFSKILDFGKMQGNKIFIVQEKLCQTFYEYRKERGNIPLPQVLQMGEKLVDILKTLHDIGYIHNDIKPDNCMMRLTDNLEAPDLFLIDFGMCVKQRT